MDKQSTDNTAGVTGAADTPVQEGESLGNLRDLEMDWLAEHSLDRTHQFEERPLQRARAYSGTDIGEASFGEVRTGRDGWLIKESTAATYRTRANRLWRDAAERKARLKGDLEAPAIIKPMDVVDYLNWRRLQQPGLPPISQATWLSYRSALLWDFSRTKEPEFALACSALERMTYQGGGSTQDRPIEAPEVQKTGIKKADLARLIDQLGTMNRGGGSSSRNRVKNWGRRTQFFLQAGIATGLRPGEWEYARWADEHQNLLIAPTLKVKASPAAYARPRWLELTGQDPTQEDVPQQGTAPEDLVHPPKHLPLRAIPVEPADRFYVAGHLSSIREAADLGLSFREYQEYCRHALWRACRQLWGGTKRYSLYHSRHQFSANARGKLSPDELATLMGHSRRSTASQHYADARHAHRRSSGAMKHGQQQAAQELAPIDAPAQLAAEAGAHNPAQTETSTLTATGAAQAS